jgi:hypothetical protein
VEYVDARVSGQRLASRGLVRGAEDVHDTRRDVGVLGDGTRDHRVDVRDHVADRYSRLEGL